MICRDKLPRIDLAMTALGAALPPLTPGEVLLEEFMRPSGLTTHALAAEMHIPQNRLSSVIAGSRRMTAKMAVRLGRRFGTSAELWLNLQTAYDLTVERHERPAGK